MRELLGRGRRRREEAEEAAATGAIGEEEILVSNGEAVGEEVAELCLGPTVPWKVARLAAAHVPAPAAAPIK